MRYNPTISIVPSSDVFVAPGSQYFIVATIRSNSGNYINSVPITFKVTFGPQLDQSYNTQTNDVGTANWLFTVTNKQNSIERIQAFYQYDG